MTEKSKHIKHIKRMGIIGWPVEHSLSPLIYHHWLAENNMDGCYEKYEKIAVRPNDLHDFIMRLAENNFLGINITIPHKNAAYAVLMEMGDKNNAKITAAAQQARSVNMIFVRDDGALKAASTDGIGFWTHLKQASPDWQPHGIVVLLGAGGASSILACQLAMSGVRHFRLCNRTAKKAEKLAALLQAIGKNIKIDVFDWTQRGHALDKASLLIHATSLGMRGQPALELDLSLLPKTAPVADIVYQPLITPLLAEAKMRGHAIIDGLGMLIHQAAPVFELWFGKKPHISKALRQKLEQALSAPQ